MAQGIVMVLSLMVYAWRRAVLEGWFLRSCTLLATAARTARGHPQAAPISMETSAAPTAWTRGEQPVLPPSVSLSVDTCFSGATVLITGLSPLHAAISCLSSCECCIYRGKLWSEADALKDSVLGRRPGLVRSFPILMQCSFAGVTGFVGSVVLEQLLRVCPSVKRVYVVIREKRGLTGA